MEQYGLMLCGLRSGLVPTGSIASIRSALQAEEIPVWMPSTMVSSDLSIAQSWAVTSDSLAAWLAARLDATDLAMIKSMPVAKPLPSPEQMSARGWMDQAFAQFLSEARFELHVFGPGESPELKRLLVGDHVVD
jgi:dihydroneopterin aldolase